MNSFKKEQDGLTHNTTKKKKSNQKKSLKIIYAQIQREEAKIDFLLKLWWLKCFIKPNFNRFISLLFDFMVNVFIYFYSWMSSRPIPNLKWSAKGFASPERESLVEGSTVLSIVVLQVPSMNDHML